MRTELTGQFGVGSHDVSCITLNLFKELVAYLETVWGGKGKVKRDRLIFFIKPANSRGPRKYTPSYLGDLLPGYTPPSLHASSFESVKYVCD